MRLQKVCLVLPEASSHRMDPLSELAKTAFPYAIIFVMCENALMSPRITPAIPVPTTLEQRQYHQHGHSQPFTVLPNISRIYFKPSTKAAMADSNNVRKPKRKRYLPTRGSTIMMPYLNEDDEVKGPPMAARLQEREGQNGMMSFLAESLDLPEKRTDGKTTHLKSVYCDPLLGNSKTVISMTRYGNPPKPLPFIDKSTGDIDSQALEMYCNNCKNPQKSTSGSISRKSIGSPAKRDNPAQITCTAFERPPPLTGMNAIRLGLRRLR